MVIARLIEWRPGGEQRYQGTAVHGNLQYAGCKSARQHPNSNSYLDLSLYTRYKARFPCRCLIADELTYSVVRDAPGFEKPSLLLRFPIFLSRHQLQLSFSVLSPSILSACHPSDQPGIAIPWRAKLASEGRRLCGHCCRLGPTVSELPAQNNAIHNRRGPYRMPSDLLLLPSSVQANDCFESRNQPINPSYSGDIMPKRWSRCRRWPNQSQRVP